MGIKLPKNYFLQLPVPSSVCEAILIFLVRRTGYSNTMSLVLITHIAKMCQY